MIIQRKYLIAKSINPIFLALLTLLLLMGLFYRSLNAHTSTFYFLFHDPEWGFSNSVEAIERLSPFCDFLSETLDKKISPLYLKQQNHIEGHLSSPEVLFGMLNANVVSQKQDKFALKPFLLPVRKGKTTYHKVLLIPNHMKVNDISELEGKRLAILTSDKYNLQEQLSFVTSKEFIDPYRFFDSIVTAASTESAISSFRLKLSDCALVARDSFELTLQKNPDLRDQIKILYLSPPMTNSPIIKIGRRITPDEASKLQAALLSLSESESGRKLLRLIYVDAFQGLPRPQLIEKSLLAEKPSLTRTPEMETIYYVIKKGDTLWDLAGKFLGSGRQYRIIAEINKIKNPDMIWAGRKIKIIKQKEFID